ncbi:retrovirus-related pol polyprotein from transposon TNT 1-94 [Tanacetum coccineum]
MTLEIHNWSSSAHQEVHKIVKDEIFLIVNQVDASVQNFKIQFLKEVAKFVRDFQSLAKEADESLAKHKALELEIERLLRAVVSQDIMSIVQNNSVGNTSNLQTELERTKERFENSYNDVQQKIERLQAQLGDQKGKSKDTSCVSDTLDPLPQKLKNENVESEFQVRNYEKENAYLKTACKNLFDSINVTRAQTKLILDSLQNKLHDTIYENAKLRAQLFDKVFEQKDTTKGVDITTKTRRPQPRSNTKNDRVPFASKSSRIKNNKVEVEEHPRNLLLSKNTKHMSFECNNVKLAIQNDKSEIVCAMCFGDLQWGNILITRVYFVEGMGHNLFSVGQFYDSDLEATSTKSWLWHQWLSHLNFDTINDLARNNLLTGLPKFKYHKELFTILLGLPEDIYVAVDSYETAQEIWLYVQQMMKGFDIGIQEKKAKLFNEWERFTSTDGESIESYYHRFSKLMNDFKRNKHFLEKIASNLKFLNNLQPEWSRHVTIVHQTKDLHTTDYTQLYNFLKYNQKEVDDLRAERLAKTQDPLALMAISNNPFNYPLFHPNQPSSSTYIQ